jgi:hypothetical protein
MATLERSMAFRPPLQGLRKFLNFSFEARDLIAQVTIGHTRGVQFQVSLLMRTVPSYVRLSPYAFVPFTSSVVGIQSCEKNLVPKISRLAPQLGAERSGC